MRNIIVTWFLEQVFIIENNGDKNAKIQTDFILKSVNEIISYRINVTLHVCRRLEYARKENKVK